MQERNLNWRSFTDQGEINSQWNVPGTPTYYILDHKGVIRAKWMGYPGEKAIDTTLDKLIDEAEKNGKKTSK